MSRRPGVWLAGVNAREGIRTASLLTVAAAKKERQPAPYYRGAQLVAALSPILAGSLKDRLGMEFVFYYAAILIAISALILIIRPSPGPRLEPPSPQVGQPGKEKYRTTTSPRCSSRENELPTPVLTMKSGAIYPLGWAIED